MPRFTGQNKKRIDPRYFLEETTNMDFTERLDVKEINFGGDDEDRRNWDNEKPAIQAQLRDELDELGMDWILDDISFDLVELGAQSSHAAEYKKKIKDYLNKNADKFGYSKLGDEIFRG